MSPGGEDFPRSFSVGDVEVSPPLVMAPMADITDVHFHELLRGIGGPGLYTAEMVPGKALADGVEWPRRMLKRPAWCKRFAIQLYGARPEQLAIAAQLAAEEGPDIVDINMGCPAKKITGRAGGSGLLRDLKVVREIFGAVRKALPDSIPLTVKIRTGWDDKQVNYIDVGRIACEEGLAAITLHGRTRTQMFRGQSDWSAIAELAASCPIPVIGNGDVKTADDVLTMLSLTGCAGVMIGRGVLHDPWIFQQASELLAGRPAVKPTREERRRLILEHVDRLVDALPRAAAIHRIRTLTGHYLGGLPDGQQLKRELLGVHRTPENFRETVDRLLSDPSLSVA